MKTDLPEGALEIHHLNVTMRAEELGEGEPVYCQVAATGLVTYCTISLGTSSIQRPSVSRSSSIVRFMSQSYHGRLYRLKPVPPLLLNHGAIAAPHFAPTAVETLAIALLEAAVGISGCQLFVDFDAPAGGVVSVKVAVLHHGAAAEDFLQAVVEGRVLLDAEVVADQVERHVCGVADGGDVAGAVPGGLDAVDLGHGGDLAHGRQAAGLAHVDADVIDQASGDERGPLVRAVEELAHGDGRGTLTADLVEVRDVFGRERVFHEEHLEALGILEELDGLVG